MKFFYSILFTAALAILLTATACTGKKKTVQKTQLSVESDPSGAMVYLLKADRGTTPFNCFLKPGTYLVRVSKEGFLPQWKTVSLKTGDRKTVSFKLDHVTADVMLESIPSGAVISFQGKTIGTTPYIFRNLPAGTHSATLKTPEFAPKMAEWTVQSPRPQKISIELTSNMGAIEVTSKPSGAVVFIDGRKVGITPYKSKMEQGKYRIKVERSGFEEQERSVGINKDQTASAVFTLAAKPSQIIISTTPAKAEITVNGKRYGESPITLSGLAAGKYTIEARKGEYDSSSKTLNIAPGQTIPVSLKLTYNLCSVEFVTVPPGVKVFLDEKVIGITEADPDVPNTSKPFRISRQQPGVHSLKFFHKRARPSQLTKKIVLEKGKDLRLSHNIDMWVENAEITLKNGEKMVGRLLAEYRNGDVKFEQVKGISAVYRKDEIQSIVRLKVQE